MEYGDDKKLLEILQKEKFLAFFDFCKTGDDGASEIDGLCKVAEPAEKSFAEYLSLTFIFDTPSEGKVALAKRIMANFTTASFKRVIPSVRAITSVPCSMRVAENYVHQIDVIFEGIITADVKELIRQMVFVVRSAGGLDTEVPQWWEDEGDSAPKQTEAERSNWAARIAALLRLKI